jgi:hypothetical protein
MSNSRLGHVQWMNRYKGIVPTFLSGAPYTGLQMSTYEMFKRWLPTTPVCTRFTLAHHPSFMLHMIYIGW